MAVIEETQTGVFSELSSEAARVSERVRKGVVVVRGEEGGHGSGVVWREDGVIVTNDHVVASDRAEVALADGREFEAEVFRRDRARDLAALRVRGSGLPVVPVGDSDALRPGQLVLAVGNPLGITGAVSIGIISRAPRDVRVRGHRQFGMVQADVDLYPGNSGGPLVDAEGRVVGINSMVIGPGMALAVPSHAAEAFVAGSRIGAYLGMTIRGVRLPAAIAAPLGVDVEEGLMVFDLSRNGPAEQAGVIPGDLLIALDGHTLRGSDDLQGQLARLGPRRPARLTVLRGGRLVDVTAVPESRESAAMAA
ncbi:MAG TPA: trypsin-like peptidase domain-containing protein [Chloroflexota bacterium]